MTEQQEQPLRRSSLDGLLRTSPLALHRQLADLLRERIVAGELKSGDQLPTETALMERHGISRITARNALDQLVRDGLIVRQRGKGTFVAAQRVRHPLESVRGIYEDLVAQGLSVATSLISFDLKVPPEPLASRLGASGTPVAAWNRLYVVDGQPFAVSDVHLAPLPRPVDRDLAERHVTYEILEGEFGIPIDRAEMTVRSALAAGALQERLALAPGDPVLVLERTSFAADGRALEHTIYSAVASRYEFTISMQGRIPVGPPLRAMSTSG